MTGKGTNGMSCGSPEASHTTVAQQNSVNCSVMNHKLTCPFPSRFSCLPLALTANPQLPWCFSELTLPTSFPLKVGVAYRLVCHILSCACCFPPRCHIPSHLQLSWYMHVHAHVCVCVCVYVYARNILTFSFKTGTQLYANCLIKRIRIIVYSFELKYKFKPS